ncbi:MAG: DUF3800 domain-containing protein [Caldilineaceae bacterium]|nr:DUF3800 domain-containing protein [Caldilineaceae bacterium]
MVFVLARLGEAGDTLMTTPRFLHIYCDESRHMAHRFMVLGGLILDRRYEESFNRSFLNYCSNSKMHSELKWNKVSRGKLQEYKSLLDLVSSCNKYIHFKALVVDTHQMNLRRYNKNNLDDAINRLLYQFLVHMFGSYLNTDDQCIVTLDQRNTSQKLSTLCAIANNGLRKKHKFQHHPIREIKAANSKQCCYIQIADVLMGAIGFQMNGDCNKSGASDAKCDLMNYILEQYGLQSFSRSTPRFKRDFSIWHFQFSNK